MTEVAHIESQLGLQRVCAHRAQFETYAGAESEFAQRADRQRDKAM